MNTFDSLIDQSTFVWAGKWDWNNNQQQSARRSMDQSQILLDIKNNQGTKFYQTAEYYDHIGWWSLAYTRAYKIALSRNDNDSANYFLTTAGKITDDFCNGGCYWSRTSTYKNAITNEL
jgi:predicted alpha-1,6-mannanase (GH76 family)